MPPIIGYPKQRIPRTQKNLDLAKRAKQLTAAAKTYRQSKRERAWDLSEKQWAGDQWGEAQAFNPDNDLVTVNVSFSTINTILPYVTGSDPSFIIEPYGGKATPQNARLLEALLNRIWRSSRMAGNQHLRRSTWDHLIYGDGFVKVSYTFDQVFKGDGLNQATVANLWVDRLNPKDVWLDPDADGIHNARFIVARVFRSVEQLQADPRYRNTGDLEAGDDRILEAGERGLNTVDTDHDRDKIVAVYEFYDLDANQLVTWTDQVDVPLQIVEGITCPIIGIPNHTIPNCPYHMGELEQLVPLQQELNKTRTQMVEHRRRNAQKWLVRKGSLGADARAALQSEEVNDVVEITGDNRLDDILTPLQVPNLAADVYQVDQLIKGDVYEISGVNEYLRGGSPDIRRTATEATIIEGATNVKTAQKLRVIETAARQIGQMLLDVASAVYPLTDEDEMTLILTGRDAQAVLAAEGQPADPNMVAGARLTPGAGMFDGTYEVFVEQGSTELRNPVLREQKYKEMFSILMGAQPTLAQQGIRIDMRKVVELWLDAAGVDDIDAILASGEMGPPQQQGPQMQGGMLAQGMGSVGAAAGPPTAPITAENSGIMPPS